MKNQFRTKMASVARFLLDDFLRLRYAHSDCALQDTELRRGKSQIPDLIHMGEKHVDYDVVAGLYLCVLCFKVGEFQVYECRKH